MPGAVAVPRHSNDPRATAQRCSDLGLENSFERVTLRVVQLDDAIGQLEVTVIVGDAEDSFAAQP